MFQKSESRLLKLVPKELKSEYWRELYALLRKMLLSPWSHPPFAFFFFFGVLLLGASGVWFTVCKQLFAESFSLIEVTASIAVFFPALCLASTWDIIFPEDNNRSLRSLAVLIATVAVSLAILSLLLAQKDSYWAIVPAVTGLLFGVVSWVLANGENPNLMASRNINEAIGGDLDRPILGSLDEYHND